MKQKAKIAMRNASVSELTKQIQTSKSHIAALTINRYTKPSRNVREIKNIHHEIAVAETILREKELGA